MILQSARIVAVHCPRFSTVNLSFLWRKRFPLVNLSRINSNQLNFWTTLERPFPRLTISMRTLPPQALVILFRSYFQTSRSVFDAICVLFSQFPRHYFIEISRLLLSQLATIKARLLEAAHEGIESYEATFSFSFSTLMPNPLKALGNFAEVLSHSRTIFSTICFSYRRNQKQLRSP